MSHPWLLAFFSQILGFDGSTSAIWTQFSGQIGLLQSSMLLSLPQRSCEALHLAWWPFRRVLPTGKSYFVSTRPFVACLARYLDNCSTVICRFNDYRLPIYANDYASHSLVKKDWTMVELRGNLWHYKAIFCLQYHWDRSGARKSVSRR